MSRRGRKPTRWDLIESGAVAWLDPKTGQRVLALDEMGDDWTDERRQLVRAEHSFRTMDWFKRLSTSPEKYPRLPECYQDDESMLWEYASQWAIEDMRRGRRAGTNYTTARVFDRAKGSQPRITDEEIEAAYKELTPRVRKTISQAAGVLHKNQRFAAIAPGTLRNRLAKIVARLTARNSLTRR